MPCCFPRFYGRHGPTRLPITGKNHKLISPVLVLHGSGISFQTLLRFLYVLSSRFGYSPSEIKIFTNEIEISDVIFNFERVLVRRVTKKRRNEGERMTEMMMKIGLSWV